MNRNNENLLRLNAGTAHILNTIQLVFAIIIIMILQIVGKKYTYCSENNEICDYQKLFVIIVTWICSIQIIVYFLILIGVIIRKKLMFIPFFIVTPFAIMLLSFFTFKNFFHKHNTFGYGADLHIISIPIFFSIIYITVTLALIHDQYENLKKDELLERQNPSSNGIQIRPSNTGPSEFDRLTNFNQQSNQAQPTSFVRPENYELPSAPSGIEDSERNDSNKVKPSHQAASQNNNPKSYGWNP